MRTKSLEVSGFYGLRFTVLGQQRERPFRVKHDKVQQRILIDGPRCSCRPGLVQSVSSLYLYRPVITPNFECMCVCVCGGGGGSLRC